MTKKDKRRIKPKCGTDSKIGKQLQLTSSTRAGRSRYIIWSISILMVAIAMVSAWAIFGNSLRSSSETTSMNQSQPAGPSANSGSGSDSLYGGPQISFPEMSYDFGTIAQGSKVSHTFIVQNIGDAPLRLIKAQGT
jgi:hypothetical protein